MAGENGVFWGKMRILKRIRSEELGMRN